MNIYEKLQAVQAELKVPKGQFNDFGKYKYRSCEDILEAVKPVLAAHNAAITVGDELINLGDRYYVKAIATFYDTEKGDTIQNAAFAREPENKKGMDDSQITGTASSYARKYALGGLLLIDDTKDADTNEYAEQTGRQKQQTYKPEPVPAPKKATKAQLTEIVKLVSNIQKLCDYYHIERIEDLTADQAAEVIARKAAKA